MKLRKSVAAAALAGAAVFTVAACSSSDDNASTTTASTSAATNAESSAVESSGSDAPAPADLDNAAAQAILDKALNPDTSSTDLDAVVDTSSPLTKPAIQAFAKGSKQMGYTYKVTKVSGDGNDAALVTFDVGGAHSASGLQMKFVKVDGSWKLSGDAVTFLQSMAGGH
ncbi:MAG TPA: hypothetical protein DIW80_01010 [Gordonia polyisoprenivorans]|uniref:hypothetical protein n=1 Tax=Gordonia polyisoprenivorans TaxID=84595 RepID=UPI0003697093|nr:hypothetical protein [Gordonia polyisoprenivorans]OZC31595.1 hypothetical protein CJJ17_08995 [Gordonia polyisoprenivorans]QUD84028.1 hypothetical protein J8M97_05155 [Gordonia polyisoprenivorans]UZF54959.1 hypothetical protein LH935_19835 [Gordonia polyisoprenivorans]HCS56042.1 hypothetical protein [Gordonia polyisoprenivorans]